jgi:hypothetical protein
MADDKKVEAKKDKRKEALYTGIWVFFMLVVLTVGEFIVGVIAPPWAAILIFVAAFKAFWVIKDYMHIDRLFSSDEELH